MKLLAALLLTAAFAAKPVPTKTKCTAKELKRQDCRLTANGYELSLLEKTVAWSDGIWHTVDPLPLSGEGVEWESVRFDFYAKHPIVQMWIWDKGVGESQVQSLHWYVADAEKRQFTVLAEGVVRKRHLKLPPPGVDQAPPPAPKKGVMPAPPPKPKYLFDAEEKHAIKALKNGQIEWSLGRQKKILDKLGGKNGV